MTKNSITFGDDSNRYLDARSGFLIQDHKIAYALVIFPLLEVYVRDSFWDTTNKLSRSHSLMQDPDHDQGHRRKIALLLSRRELH